MEDWQSLRMGGNLEIMVSKCGIGLSGPLKKTKLWGKIPLLLKREKQAFCGREEARKIVKNWRYACRRSREGIWKVGEIQPSVTQMLIQRRAVGVRSTHSSSRSRV